MIRKATTQDIDAVERSYTELLQHEQTHGAYTVWQSGIYPTRQTAKQGLAEGALYVAEQDGELCASMIMNQIQPEEYHQIKWQEPAAPDQVLVIHLLCVRPSKAGRGIGKEMVQFAIEEGKRLHCSAIRLDTGPQNKPAVALYQKLGFEIAATGTMAVGGLISHNDHLFFEKRITASVK